MSIEATEWALCTAPKHSTDSVRLVLLGLAKHAWKDGSNAYPSQGTLASYLAGGDTPANRRKVKRAVKELEAGGWIRRGWNKNVAAMPKGQRPTVWNLNLSFVESHEPPGVTDVTTPGSPVTPPWGHSRSGVGSLTAIPGVTSDTLIVKNHQESLNESGVTSDTTLKAASTKTEAEEEKEVQDWKNPIEACSLCDDFGRRLDMPSHVRRDKATCHHNKEQSA